MVTKAEVLTALAGVPDPEIPAINVVDLGIVERVEVEGSTVEIDCLPTFVGCPALEVIRGDIESAVREIGGDPKVEFVYHPPWTSDRISEQGRRKLAEWGLVPPSRTNSPVRLELLSKSACPYCGSKDTDLDSPFGPTLCRATAYCRSCKNPFEIFKPV